MKVLQYEIEKELIVDKKCALKPSSEPQITSYDGLMVSVRIQGLAPGCSYRYIVNCYLPHILC